MIITLKNDRLTVDIDTLGAEMQAVTGADGTQYLWGGDAAYWGNRATNLFPHVGRLTDQAYTVGGKRYQMGIHGFLRHMETEAKDVTATHALFEMRDTPDTLAQYPFPFVMGVDYRLAGDTLHIVYRVRNTGDGTMYFGVGGHPGFRVPLEKGLAFEDYALAFEGESRRWLLSDTSYTMTGETVPYPKADGVLPLRHDLFDQDAIILENEGRQARLYSDKGQRAVTLRHPQMPYLGLWHKPHSDAPYVCLEPWLSLPARHGVVEAFETQPGLVHLVAGDNYENAWSIQFE
ncbi:MAG: aldose 1-epimerase family protein [Clostridiales bacterium]|nr:aldose 1-epimerase family protein [Clostridiales bacterium]